MFGQALAWFVVQTLCLVTLVASQTRLIYPANDAPDRSTMVLRGRNYRDYLLTAQYKRFFTGFESGDLPVDESDRGSLPNENYVVDHVLELELVQKFFKGPGTQGEIAPDRWRFLVKVATRNVNALGDDQNAIDLQRRLIARLNSVDDASDRGNLVAVGGADIGDSGQLNGLENVGLTRNPKDTSWSFAGAVWTYHYLEKVLPRYQLIASRIDDLLELNEAFTNWSAAAYQTALSKLGGMNPAAICKRDLNRRAAECQWSNALINEGNGVYTALGDSFSAGIGAGIEDESRNTDGRTCRRFDNVYPHGLNNSLNPSRFDFFAWSGDVIANLLDSQLSQVDSFSSLVTMTIGGNNVNFAGAVKACVYNHLKAISTTFALFSPMRSTESKGWTPHANILALGSPAFNNVDGGNGLNCNVESKYRKRMNDLGGKLNDQIKAAVKDAGVAYADPNDAFTAHRFCDTSNPWFISERPSLGKRDVLHRSKRQTDIVQQELDEFGRWTQTFFHPTLEGQVAYFRVADAAISRFKPTKPIGKNWKEEDGDV